EDLVVGDLGAVGRIRGQAAFGHRQRLSQSAIDTDAELALRPTIARVTPRQENNALAVWRPRHHFIENAHTVAERLGTALVERQLLGLAALGRHYVDVEVSVVLAGESDPFAIGRKLGEHLAAGSSGDAPRYTARTRRQPQVAGIEEDHL